MVSRDAYDSEQVELPRAKAAPAVVLRKKSYSRPIALKNSAVNASNLKSMQATQNNGGDVLLATAFFFAAIFLWGKFEAAIFPATTFLMMGAAMFSQTYSVCFFIPREDFISETSQHLKKKT
jgi:hypothetical protein